MRSMTLAWAGAIVATLSLLSPMARAADLPPLIHAFVQQLVRQCGGEMTPALATQVVRQLDLNGDKLDDWVVDENLYACPSRPAALQDLGRNVTVFLSRPDGRTLPALQRTAFGSRIEGRPETGYSLWLTLGGSACGGADPKARCDRKVAWRAAAGQLTLIDPSAPKLATTPAASMTSPLPQSRPTH